MRAAAEGLLATRSAPPRGGHTEILLTKNWEFKRDSHTFGVFCIVHKLWTAYSLRSYIFKIISFKKENNEEGVCFIYSSSDRR